MEAKSVGALDDNVVDRRVVLADGAKTAGVTVVVPPVTTPDASSTIVQRSWAVGRR